MLNEHIKNGLLQSISFAAVQVCLEEYAQCVL